MRLQRLFALVLFLVFLAKGQETNEEIRKCIKERKRVMVSLKKKIDICLTKVSSTTGDESSIRGCIAKCVLRMENALDENDNLTEASFEKSMGNRASGRSRDLLLKIYGDCHKQHGRGLQPGELCIGYESMGLCIEGGFYTLCEDLAALIEKEKEERESSKSEL